MPGPVGGNRASVTAALPVAVTTHQKRKPAEVVISAGFNWLRVSG